ncbi:hypothetical protein Nepgr_017380 [Nepenthes gracilis]|uniref:Uncharacterized protein n=1 Tax=Nepenthes gracilis TaxID=150966 RepID=A0AAD3XT15_NEPGR|nr:hypothetical protein Nepgr_017380 [Nepenthes gracilis]
MQSQQCCSVLEAVGLKSKHHFSSMALEDNEAGHGAASSFPLASVLPEIDIILRPDSAPLLGPSTGSDGAAADIKGEAPALWDPALVGMDCGRADQSVTVANDSAVLKDAEDDRLGSSPFCLIGYGLLFNGIVWWIVQPDVVSDELQPDCSALVVAAGQGRKTLAGRPTQGASASSRYNQHSSQTSNGNSAIWPAHSRPRLEDNRAELQAVSSPRDYYNSRPIASHLPGFQTTKHPKYNSQCNPIYRSHNIMPQTSSTHINSDRENPHLNFREPGSVSSVLHNQN